MMSPEVREQFQAVTISGGTFFRSCHVGGAKYRIGDFVVVRGVNETIDDANVVRIEACCDRGSKYAKAKRIVVYCTPFLRKGDIPRLKQDDRELVMDKRKAAGSEMILASDVRYTCEVVHSDDLELDNSTSFYYHSGFDGRRLFRLSVKETKPSFSYRLRRKGSSESVSDEENQSPVPVRRKNAMVSTAAYVKLKPLRDIELSANDTASQSDDLDDVMREGRSQTPTRRQLVRGKTYTDSTELEISNDSKSSRTRHSVLPSDVSITKPVTRVRPNNTAEKADNPSSERRATRSMIESVKYDANDGSALNKSPDKAKDPYDFTDDDTPSPPKQHKSTTKNLRSRISDQQSVSKVSTNTRRKVPATASTKSSKTANNDEPNRHFRRSARQESASLEEPEVSTTRVSSNSLRSKSCSSWSTAELEVVRGNDRAVVDESKSSTRVTRLRRDPSTVEEKQNLTKPASAEAVKSASRSSLRRKSAAESETKPNKTRTRKYCQDISLLGSDSSEDSDSQTQQKDLPTRKSAVRRSVRQVTKVDVVESTDSESEDAETVSRQLRRTSERGTDRVGKEPQKLRRRDRAKTILEEMSSKDQSSGSRRQSRRSIQRIPNQRENTEISDESEDEEAASKRSRRTRQRGTEKESCEPQIKRNTRYQSESTTAETSNESQQTCTRRQFGAKKLRSDRVDTEHSEGNITDISDESEDEEVGKQSRRTRQRGTDKQVMESCEPRIKRNTRYQSESTTAETSNESQQTCTRRQLGRSANKKVKSYKLDAELSDSDVDEVYKPGKEIAELSDESEDSDTSELADKQSRRSSRRVTARDKERVGVTPRSRRSLATCTPSVRDRVRPVKQSGTVLERARAQLHVSVVPESLPCREEEFANILGYVEGKLESGTGGCLYISGVPGTGKTATVFEVMRHLEQNRHKDSSLPKFKFISINGMRLTQPHQAFVQIYKCLTEKKVTADHATSLLDSMFCKARRQESIVLLVDELDLLMTRKQDVLYNLFDWPTKPRSKLIVLAIANTMDLPERVMMNRVSSRLGLNRMTFQPYTFQQLQEIVHSRLTGISAFDPDAVQLASRKVAAVSGDARRALDICRRSTEVAETDGMELVNMQHVDRALQEMFSSPKITAIRNCSFYEKIVLKAILAEFTRSGLEEATLHQVSRHIDALCAMDRMPTIRMMQMMKICTNLNNIKLLLLECNGKGIYQRVRLNVGQDDVQYALREDKS